MHFSPWAFHRVAAAECDVVAGQRDGGRRVGGVGAAAGEERPGGVQNDEGLAQRHPHLHRHQHQARAAPFSLRRRPDVP